MHDVFRNVGNPYFSQLIYRTVKVYGQSNASNLITFADRLFISPNEVLSNCFLNGCEQCGERLQLHIFTYLSGAFASLRDLSGMSVASICIEAHLLCTAIRARLSTISYLILSCNRSQIRDLIIAVLS